MTEDQGEQTDDERQEDGAPADGEQPDTGTDEVSKLRREAASYRRKLRDTEAERDRLVAQVDGYQRAEVERQVTEAPGGLESGKDFWTAGVQLDELRAEDGSLDSDKVRAARDRVLSEHPNWKQPSPDFDAGARQTATEREGPSFGEALKRAAG